MRRKSDGVRQVQTLYMCGIEDTLSNQLYSVLLSTVRSANMICWQNRFSVKDMTAVRHHYHHYYYDDDNEDDDDDINDRKCIFHFVFSSIYVSIKFYSHQKGIRCGAALFRKRCLMMTEPGAFWTFRHNAYFSMIKFGLARLNVEWFLFI